MELIRGIARSIKSYSEADEAAAGSVQIAQLNLREQVAMDETIGVIDMYEGAARNLGAPHLHIDTARRIGRRDRHELMTGTSGPLSGADYMGRMYSSLARAAREGRYNPETGLPN